MNYLYITIAILAGGIFALQPAINSNVARSINSALLASLVSFLVGTLLLLILNLAIGTKLPPVSKLQTIPWWLWLAGGLIGAFVVSAAIIIQPQIGAGSWVACYIFGQLTISMVLDNYGMLNLDVHPFNLMRLIGAFLLAIGAIMIANY